MIFSKSIPHVAHDWGNRVVFSHAIRYYFDEGSIVSEVGNFKNVGSETYRFGEGLIRFNIYRKIYEFKYDIGKDAVRGNLSELSFPKYGNGTKISFTIE